MHLTRLRLKNFRNHESSDISLGTGATLFLGPNAQGKTNIVEAVNYLCYGRSHRVTSLNALVKNTELAATINAEFTHGLRQITVDASIDSQGVNKAKVNGNAIRLRELSKFVHTVFFAPEDLTIIRGEPDGRRQFLDSVLQVLSPRMSGVISDYERVLKQRNSLMKSLRGVPSAHRDLTTLDIWDAKLIELGSDITSTRLDVISLLSPLMEKAYEKISGQKAVFSMELVGRQLDGMPPLVSRADIAERMAILLRETQREDLDRGLTHIGPHRDDLLFKLNDLPIKGYASQGETWSATIALKIGVAEAYRDDVLGDPIVILDDVFAELDENRRHRLDDIISTFEQVLITAAVKADVPHLENVHVFTVAKGVVS